MPAISNQMVSCTGVAARPKGGAAFSRAALGAIALLALGGAVFSQDKAPGLTGLDRPDDVIMARQTVMDGIDSEMMDIDLAGAGKEVPLADLQARANRISTLLTAFPHLFPPQTKAVPAADGTPSLSTAAPAIWEQFDAFYDQAQAGAKLAYDASQAADPAQFAALGKQLRAACDGCHAQFMHLDPPPQP